MPTAEIIGIVQFVKRELLPIEQLWEESEQGKLAKVSRVQFDAYYANQESGIGVWVGGKASLKTFFAVRSTVDREYHRWLRRRHEN
jgi:hypothetical protein